MNKPHSPSCERNKQPILEVLKTIVRPSDKSLLEVGSGTGQHAVYFASHFPQLEWVTSDVGDNHQAIRAWKNEAGLSNITGPLELEIGKNKLPKMKFDILFAANVLHIISIEKVKILIEMVGQSFLKDSQVVFYGPFNYDGQFTSQSNLEFDRWLKSRNIESGIRDFEVICHELRRFDFVLKNDFEMPANNRVLHFIKSN